MIADSSDPREGLPVTELWDQVGFLQASAGTIVLIGLLLIFTGRLVPRRTVEDVREDRDARLADRDARIRELAAERDTWRAACERSEVARMELQAQTAEQLELSRTAVHLLAALPQASGVTASAPVAQLPAAPTP
jgi:hypothetical protein